MTALVILLHLTIINQSSFIDISIAGNFFYSDRYLLQDRTVHDIDDAEILIKNILKVYNNAGFPFCEIRPIMEKDSDRITKITLNVDEGTRVVITDHIFLADQGTSPGAVRRYAYPQKGIFFSGREIKRIKQRLVRTGAFEYIEENIIQQDDRYYMLWKLHEQQTDFLNAYGSISDDDYLFSISLHSINLLGTLRQLEFLYEYRKLFSIRFTEPILLAPTNINATLSLWSYDSLQLFELNGIISTPLGRSFTISILSGIERASYGDSAVIARTNTILGGGLATHFANLWLTTDHSITLDYLVRDNDRWRIVYDGSLDVYDMLIRPHGRYVHTDSLLFFDYYRLGGAKSLRGYFEEDIVATECFWVNLEYKRLFLFPLIDIGYIEKNFLYSYGFGIEARSSFANAALIIAWSKDASWRDGILHLTFNKGF